MKILVMSDSHGAYTKLEKITERHCDADLFVFLGDGIRDAERVFAKYPDKPHYIAPGNCDFFQGGYLPVSTLDLDGTRIVCCHGHTFGVKSGISSYLEYAKEKEASAALFGHTHRQFEMNCDGVLMFCPGAVCDGAYGLVYTERGAVLCSHGNL